VSHYGEIDKVVVTAVAENSYHEYGKVEGTIELTKGRVVAESGANVPAVVIKATSIDDVKVEAASGAILSSIAATKETVANALATSENIKAPSATKETTALDESTLAKFAGGIGTAESPYLIGNLEQWKNFATDNTCSEGGYFWKVTTDLDFTDVTDKVVGYNLKGYIDFDGHTVKGLKVTNSNWEPL